MIPREDKTRIVGLRSVAFNKDVATYEIPSIDEQDKDLLFYSKTEIMSMKNMALMENAGVTGSVASHGEDLFDTSSISRSPVFRRASLQRISQKDLSPIRSSPPEQSTRTIDAKGAPAPRQRPRRAERGNLVRSKSGRGPVRTDSVAGRGPPRRAASSMAGLGKNSLQMMQASARRAGTNAA